MTVAEEIQLIGIPHTEINSVWGEVKPMLQKGISHGDGEIDIGDIYKFLADRSMQLWVLYNYSEESIVMAGVTEVCIYPKMKICRAVVLGGNKLDDWLSFISDIESWAKEQGCSRMEAHGRRGLARKMEDIGYSNKYVVMRKEI